MHKTVEKFYNDVKISRQKCPWAKKQTLTLFINELKGEIIEAEDAIKNDDMKNLEEELGDIFWDTLSLLAISEDEKGFDAKKIISNAHQKLLRRKPHVFGNEKAETVEQAVKLWEDIKKKENSGYYE